MRILLVSNDYRHFSQFKDLSKSFTSLAVTKDQALLLLNHMSFDLIFLDSYLADSEGAEVISYLSNFKIPIVAHGSTDEENLELLKLGAKVTLKKSLIHHKDFQAFITNTMDLFQSPQGS